MKYMGSKSKIAKPIVEIIQKELDKYGFEHYLDPFIGGANIADKVECKNKYGSDNQKYLIALYNNIERISELPKTVTKEHYSEVRDCYNKNLGTFEDWYVGAIGFLSSYNGRFFDGGYAGIVKTKTGTTRDYYDEAKRNLIQQVHALKEIKFFHKDFSEVKEDLSGYIIYCDPPYKGTKQYGSSKNFNTENFWEWCRIMSRNNIVLISEENAPKDFVVIWEETVNRTINNSKTKKATEKLFVYQIQNMYGLTDIDFSRLLTQEDILDLEDLYDKKFSSDCNKFNVKDRVLIDNVMESEDDICSLYNKKTGTVIRKTFYIGKLAYKVRFDEPIVFNGRTYTEDILLPNELTKI